MNENLELVTLTDIENHKRISKRELLDDLDKLKEFHEIDSKNCFYGNPFLYHFQLPNLLRCRREKRPTIYELHENSESWQKLLKQTNFSRRVSAGKTINDLEKIFAKTSRAKNFSRHTPA